MAIVGIIVQAGIAYYQAEQQRKLAHEQQDRARKMAEEQRAWAEAQQAQQLAFQEEQNRKSMQNMREVSDKPVPKGIAPEPTEPDMSIAGASGRRRVMAPSYYSTILTSSQGSTGSTQSKTLLGG